MPGDTIAYDNAATITRFNLYTNIITANKGDKISGIGTDSTAIPGPPVPQTGHLYYQNLGSGGYFNYLKDNSTPEETISHYKAGFSVISLNNENKITWRNTLNNDADSVLLTDLSNNKIVAGKKGIHIIRSATDNRKNTIEHIVITYAGKREKVNTMAWNNQYRYLVSYAAETNDGALIITCVKEGRLIFARMKLE